ncbi:MAG: YhbY family RNA-binding protein [Thermoplasmata archaeon]|nr:YhbY family RNA-binding protein [Thermoplasmata archaeon]
MNRNSRDEKIPVTVAVGKKGVTDQIIEEIKNQLVSHRIVKIKLHGETKLARFEIAKELAEKSNAKLVEVRGFTVTLIRKKPQI